MAGRIVHSSSPRSPYRSFSRRSAKAIPLSPDRLDQFRVLGVILQFNPQLADIRALREEGDPPSGGASSCWNYFYPRPPRGGRHSEVIHLTAAYQFLSTPSARRATAGKSYGYWRLDISIHALREEGDRSFRSSFLISTYFYPRPPRGGRQDRQETTSVKRRTFLSTPSARRATQT